MAQSRQEFVVSESMECVVAGHTPCEVVFGRALLAIWERAHKTLGERLAALPGFGWVRIGDDRGQEEYGP